MHIGTLDGYQRIGALYKITSYSKEILYVPTCIDSQVFTTAKLKMCEQQWEYTYSQRIF